MVDRAGIAVGIVAILVGLAAGYAMVAAPEHLNPAYPVWIGVLAPLAFVVGGLLVCAHASGHPRYVGLAFGVLALCLLVIVNWAAFFTTGVRCRETIAFLGVALLERYPSDAECRAGLRVLVASLDAIVLIPLAAVVWRRVAGRLRDPTR